MKPLPSYAGLPILIFLQLTLFLPAVPLRAQSVTLSPPEKETANRLRIDVIARHEDNILVYKATHPYALGPIGPAAAHSYGNSTICIYDTSMHAKAQKPLPLPRLVTGLQFLTYDNFFYIFYQYLHGRTLYAMAAKIAMDGSMIGSPVKMDSCTLGFPAAYPSEIFTVIYSENKEHIVLFCVGRRPSRLHALFFDRNLAPVRATDIVLDTPSFEWLSEFHADNDGNLVFIGMNSGDSRLDTYQSRLMVLPHDADSIYSTYFMPKGIFIDDPHILVDNLHRKYILSSFYTKRLEAGIRGLFCYIHDAGSFTGRQTMTALSDQLRRQAEEDDIPLSFSNYYIQDMHLRGDGGFTVEAQQLKSNPDRGFFNRWSFIPRDQKRERSFTRFDPYGSDHYYPWNFWSETALTFSSQSALISCFDSTGLVEWVNAVRMSQLDSLETALGFKSVITDGSLYLLFNTHIRKSTWLTARTIDAHGTLDIDTRIREDVPLGDGDKGYRYFPRLAIAVGAGEIILPCRKAQTLYLARVNLHAAPMLRVTE